MAYILNIPPEALVGQIGHDGSKKVGIWWEAFHIQEFVPVLKELGLVMSPIILDPHLEYPDGQQRRIENDWMKYCWDRDGIITGIGNKYGHAVAWRHNLIRDPKGHVYRFEDAQLKPFNFTPEIVYLIYKIS
jgi:hypothetical protein